MLHANWSEGRLHLWGELPARFRALLGGANSASRDSRGSDAQLGHGATNGAAFAAVATAAAAAQGKPHPFAATHDDLLSALSALSALHGGSVMAEPGAVDVRLPTAAGVPAASDDLAGIVEAAAEIPESGLATFSIPSIAVSADDALRLLLRLDELNAGAGLGAGAGPGLRWLRGVAELVADLLAQQRFVPTLYRRGGSRLEARWTPWLDDGETRRRIEQILEAMPPAARAAVDAARHAPWPILEEALLFLTDATVRRCLIEQDFFEAIAERDGDRDLNVAWLRGLLGPSAGVTNGQANGQRADLFASVRDWMATLASPRHARPYSLALRLEEPVVVEADDIDSRWSLVILLARQDGLVRAADLWRSERTPGVAPAIGLEGKAEEIEEFILRETARAAALYEPLREALHGRAPRGIELSTDQAYSFLRDVAPILEESGIRIIAPAWWGRPAGRLGLRLLLQPHDSGDGVENSVGEAGAAASEARLGLAALVGYQWQAAIGERALSLDEFKRLASRTAPLVHLGGQWIEVREEDVTAARDLLEREPAGDMTIIEAMQTAYGVRGSQLGLPVLGVESTGWLRDLLEGGGGAGFCMVPQPKQLQGELRPYQRAGLSWLAFLDRFGLGACLADDMGLGKTVQLIALLQHERENRESVEQRRNQPPVDAGPEESTVREEGSCSLRPTLIIAPMSVISNWMREVQRFAPELRVRVHHGGDRLTGESFERAARDVDVVITTYGLSNRDVETLRRVHWRRVVLDEAQFVKNAPTKQAQAIRSLRADRRVALTGTPVENRLSELWSIMDFCNPSYLGVAAEFRREFAIPIERRRDHSRGEALRALIRPFVLRRLKTDPDVVPDLPDLVESSEHAPLTDEQARLYRDVVADMLQEVDAAEGMQRRGLVLAGIVRLKQICNHPASLGEPELDLVGVGADVSKIPARDDSPQHASSSTVPLAQRSGKVKVLLELLEEVLASGDRALIFTQYRRMGQLLARIIPHELHTPVLFLHGGTPRAKRQEMIDQFQSPSGRAPVFILSLRAGGVGLNLTAANHVFHFDRWWNPAVENQATDRAFRIGQTKTVQVHRIICTGTLEDRIDQMIEEKTELAETIVGAGDAWLTELSTTQLRDLLMLRESALESEV